ncbi:hypothetical protein [Aquibacillus salsiterrae]|uniref:RNA polymerase subunit sigma-70 n=1 Tax=Aquibacillus salsiterrae TaxID=2950439 RepID=A0A9X4AF31_9BACI|nr:hypothetical protein [Aquibacillus salsiterrae]MDC3415628.1 hypothetical protein [Aquibacillus salsiterrae]
MRYNEKHPYGQVDQFIYGVDFHRFTELEGKSNSMEIAEELGVSLRDVKKLKEKLNRS